MFAFELFNLWFYAGGFQKPNDCCLEIAVVEIGNFDRAFFRCRVFWSHWGLHMITIDLFWLRLVD